MRLACILFFLSAIGCESIWSTSLVPNPERCEVSLAPCPAGLVCDSRSGRCASPINSQTAGSRCGTPWRTGSAAASFANHMIPVASGQGGDLVSISLGDFDGDGQLDLGAVSANTTLWSLRGGGDGQFSPLGMSSAGSSPRMLRMLDFDGDQRADYVISNRSAKEIRCTLSAADGQLGTTAMGSLGGLPGQFVVADFDRDGALDVVTTQQGASDLAVLTGNGKGGLSTGQNVLNTRPATVLATGDFNEDGAPDLASINTGAGEVQVYINKGSPTFQRQDLALSAELYAYWIAVGDFDCDSHMDLAVGTTGRNRILVLYGDGQGRFPGTVSVNLSAEPREIQAADLDGDGQPDIAYYDQYGDVFTLQAAANRTFPTAPQAIAGPTATASLQVADVNLDGRADLVMAHQYLSVMTLVNTTP